MNDTELARLKEDWLASNAVVALLGALLVGQSWTMWEGSEGTVKLLWILTVPDYTRTVILAFILGLVGLSLFLATASIVTPLQGRGLRTIRGVWPILQPIILALFIVSWLSSNSELPHDQWWSPYLFLGGFGMLLLIGFRPQLIPLFRFLYRKCRRLLISNRRSNTESDGSIDVGPSGAPERASLGDRMRSLRAYCQLPESRVFWIATTLFIVVIEVCLVFVLWDWLSDDESASATIRNVGLVIAGSVALPLAIWRALVADRQAAAAQRQADSARRSMLNERYQKGAEMLGSEVLSVRTGGIYTLQRLSEKYPSSYHVQVMRLFCAFVRHPTKDKKIEFHPESDEEQDEQIRTLRADVQDTMQAIGSRSLASISLERCKDFKLYLRGADMSHLQVRAARLSGAWLTKANLSGAVLPYADLSSARLRQADLPGVQLRHADMSNAKFWGADLSGTILCDTNLILS